MEIPDNIHELLRIGTYPCTKQQVRVLLALKSEIVNMFQHIVWQALAARESIVRLPHENENGERVVHGANKMMSYIATQYYMSAQSLVVLVDEPRGRDWLPWMYLRNRQNNYMPEWLGWVVEQNGGKPPDRAMQNSDVKSDEEVSKERSLRNA